MPIHCTNAMHLTIEIHIPCEKSVLYFLPICSCSQRQFSMCMLILMTKNVLSRLGHIWLTLIWQNFWEPTLHCLANNLLFQLSIKEGVTDTNVMSYNYLPSANIMGSELPNEVLCAWTNNRNRQTKLKVLKECVSLWDTEMLQLWQCATLQSSP